MNKWKTVKLSDICILEKGQQIDTSLLDDSKPYRYINGGIKESGYFDNFNTSGESVLISEGGASCGYINYVNENFWCGCHCYRLHDIKAFPKYLFHALKANQQRIMALRTGSAMPNIQKSTIQKFELKIHDDSTSQKKVATILDKCNELIEKHKQTLEKYDMLIKSRFIEMFGDNPIESGKWEVETLADVCSSVVRGPFGSALKKDVFVPKSNNTVKVYEQKHAIQKSANIGTYYISQEKYEELKRFECKPGDFIMSCSGTMGEFYQLPIGCEKGIINQALCKFSLNNKIEALFFLEWMKQSIHNLETKGSGIQNVAAVSFIKQMPVFLPPLTLQNTFAAFVQQIDKSKFEYTYIGVAA